MTYEETIEFLYGRLPAYHRIGKAAYKADLLNSLALDNYFGSPHRKFRSLHIAGTNGKGSVSHMVASVLQEAGYRTGLYTSPHLKDYRERIRINGEMIPEEYIVSFVERSRKVIESVNPSFFELSVAMAFDYFAAENVELAVIETGLGGRLDSTNIITPVVSVITNIGMDHTDLLGDTLVKIAAEKAGIIKGSVPVIMGESKAETDKVFREIAGELSCEIVFADKCYTCKLHDLNPLDGIRKYSLKDNRTEEELTGSTSLGGDYQSLNIQTVASVFELLKNSLSLSVENFREGVRNVVANTGLMGRWQILGNNPLTVCDTGHNKDGIEHVMKQVSNTEYKKLHMVIGFVNDKDLSQILPLLPADAKYYFTKASVERALDPVILTEKARKYGLSGSAFGNVPEALEAANNSAGPEDMIFIGGSTFVVADIL